MIAILAIWLFTVQADREWKIRKKDCETKACLDLPVHERSNCVNKCTSEPCFEEVYGAEPVSEGGWSDFIL